MTNDLGGRVAPKLTRPTGFYTTHDVAAGEAVKVGTLALLQSGELVDGAPANVGGGGIPVVVDRGEHSIPDGAETSLDNRADYGDADSPFGVKARVVNGEAFLFNVDENLDGSEVGSDVHILDNDTVQIAQPGSEPKVGTITRIEDTNSAFITVDGVA